MSEDDALREAARRAAPVRGVLGQVAARISGGSYREAACFAEVHISGTEVDVHCAGESARVRLLPARRGYRAEIVVERPPTARASEATLVRLARWIRERRAGTVSETDGAWARALTREDGAHDVRVDRAGGALALAVTVKRLPTAGQLIRWLDAARDRATR